MGVTEPGPELADELKAVSFDANALTVALSQTNFLPEEFPRQQCELICSALSGLRYGSLEGSSTILEHSIVRLSEIRRTQFQIPDESEQLDAFEDDGTPSLVRGDSLDLRFASLITSASTALDAYRAQARKAQESTSDEEYLRSLDRVEPGGIDVAESVRNLEELRSLAEAEREESSEIAELAIRAADARNSTISTVVETNSPVVIRGWLKRLLQHTRTAVVALRTTVKVVEQTGGVAAEFYKRAEQTISRVKDGTIDEVLDWLKFLDEQLGRAQHGLDKALNGPTQMTLGVVRRFGGSYVLMTPNRSMIPFSREAVAKRPTEGFVVKAVVYANDGVSTVVDWDHDFEVVYTKDTGFVSNDEARDFLIDRCTKFVRSRSPRPTKAGAVRKALRRLEVAPPNFWNQLGFDSFESFLAAGGGMERLEDYGSLTDAMVISGQAPPRIERESFLDWAHSELSGAQDGVDLHVLHLRAQSAFGLPGIPVRYALRVKKFSSVFDGDDRFMVDGGNVRLSRSSRSS